MTEKPWSYESDDLTRSIQEKVKSGEISEEVLKLFVNWSERMERHVQEGGRGWLDPVLTYIALPEEDRYAFLAYHLERQLENLESQLEDTEQ